MYENDEYRALKEQIAHWERVKHHIDIARSFRRMKSGESVTITSKPRPGFPDPAASVTLDGPHKNAVVEFLAKRHENVAVEIVMDNTKPDPGVDALRKACDI